MSDGKTNKAELTTGFCDSFVFYRSFFDAVEQIESDSAKLMLYDSIVRYGLGMINKEDFRSMDCYEARLLMPGIAVNIDKAKGRREVNRANGMRGGRPSQGNSSSEKKKIYEINQKESEKKPSITEPKPRENLNANVNDNANGNENDTYMYFGSYGWVTLSEKNYQQLISEYGKENVDNAIMYVDEWAESNKNKYGYKNWDVVIKKCLREGWNTGKNHKAAASVIDYETTPNGWEDFTL